jgi:hypothetical protein
MDDIEERVRQKAYSLWEQEGRPEGRKDAHWDMARELVAIEDNQMLTTKPIMGRTGVGEAGEPIEPIEAVENAGEFPTLTDQGEEQPYPKRRTIAATVKSGLRKRAARG